MNSFNGIRIWNLNRQPKAQAIESGIRNRLPRNKREYGKSSYRYWAKERMHIYTYMETCNQTLGFRIQKLYDIGTPSIKKNKKSVM